MNLTAKQSAVLEELHKIGRHNAFLYRLKEGCLWDEDRARLEKGDEFCAFGMGGLTFQVAERLCMSTTQVLPIFKALERKGLVLRETRNPSYQRPLYWWPVGLAKELHDEIMNSGDSTGKS